MKISKMSSNLNYWVLIGMHYQKTIYFIITIFINKKVAAKTLFFFYLNILKSNNHN